MIQELENLVRSGKFDEVEKKLRQLTPTKIDRRYACGIANIARRIYRPQLAVRILNPIVRPQSKLQAPPTDAEKMEYAESLRRLGAVKEAWEILAEIDSSQLPQVLIHQAFCLFSQWKYTEALPYLRKYLENKSLPAYSLVVGEINLAATLVQEKLFDEAEVLLKHLREKTKKDEFLLLYGNSLELTAQLYITKKDWSAALKFLDESSEFLQKTSAVENLFVQKWRAIAESFQKNKVTPELKQLFSKAQQAKHWETYRDCEFYIALLEKDMNHFLHLYMGTPYDSYRQRIISASEGQLVVPEYYNLTSSKNPKIVFDLTTASIETSKKPTKSLPLGQALHRFLIVIARDFYKPVAVLTIFGELFPDEYMNANTSANRVHQIVRRCREWLEEAHLDIKIEEIDGNYKLVVGQDVAVRIPSKPLPLETQELAWISILKTVRSKKFTTQEIMSAFESSKSNTQRFIQWALSQNKILKRGKGPQTYYQVLDRSR